MSASEYLEGAGFFILMLAGTGMAAVCVARLQTGLPPAVRFSQVGVLWLAGVFAVHVIPGMLGVLERWAVAGAAVALAVVTCLATARLSRHMRVARRPGYPEAEPSGARSWIFAAVAGGVTAVTVVALGIADAAKAPFHVDVVSFHLPNVARWIQSGTLWQVDDFIPDRSPGNYPQTGDVFSLAAMLPWESDFLVRFVNYPLLALTAAATYALVRELNVPAATAVVGTAAFIASPVVSWGAFAGLADVAMLAGFAAGCLFLVRHVRTQAPMDLLLAGVGLGLSFGSRWYAVPAVAMVVAVWLVARLWWVPERRSTLRAFAGLSGLIAVWGGFWLLRNWVESGNPVFPVKVAPLGLTIFDAPRDVFRELEGFSIAHYAGRPSIWREYFFPGFLRAMGAGAALLWLGLAGAGGYAFARYWKDRGSTPLKRNLTVVAGLVVAAALIGVVYTITPYTATGQADRPEFAWVNSRYVVPALLLGVAATGWLIAQTGRWRQAFEFVMTLAGLDGIRRIVDLPGPALGLRWLALAALLLGVAALACVVAVRLRSVSRYYPAMAAVAVVAILATVAVGLRQERRYERARYAGVSEAISYVNDKVPAGERIGFVGEGWGNYVFFGPRLGNHVEFVGKRVRGTYRNLRTGPELRRALRDGRYGLVVFHDFASIDEGLPARQEQWLRNAGWRRVASGLNPFGYNRRVTVYRPPVR